MRRYFWLNVALVLALVAAVSVLWQPAIWSLVVLVPVAAVGVYDCLQTKHAVLRNFPIVGHFRFLFEMIRPELNQYFIESNTDGMPFSREKRSVVYQRAKSQRDTLPFGTQHDVYAPGYEWLNHSIAPKVIEDKDPRVVIGGSSCEQPYSASLLNVSAMSFGSLSGNAIRALNLGAKRGGFAHNTGEGGLSPHHLQGGDLIWQIGTGYFGCRTPDGKFDPDKFAERATLPEVKMIEIKLSQGAKPGHGGILPGVKVTEEIAKIRLVPPGQTVHSPPYHKTFDSPLGLLEFVEQLRKLSGGKPVGFKLCLGRRTEFMSILKAMRESGLGPDYIAIDGGEGGTGAAPLEFSNSVGTPALDALPFAHNALIGTGLRDRVKLLTAGKITTGFHMAARLALGADVCYAARAMMLALGCLQALRCNSNHCPVGVATQHPGLAAGLVVADKKLRVYEFHRATIESFVELLGAAGLERPEDLRPWHIYRRISPTEVRHYAQIYPPVEPESIVGDAPPLGYARPWHEARIDRFGAR